MKKMKCSKKHTLGDVEFFDVTITEKKPLAYQRKDSFEGVKNGKSIFLRSPQRSRSYLLGRLRYRAIGSDVLMPAYRQNIGKSALQG